MLTKVNSATFHGNDRLTEIANLVADAIIARDAQYRLSARPSKVLSESPDRSVDSVSELRLSVTPPIGSADDQSPTGVQHGA